MVEIHQCPRIGGEYPLSYVSKNYAISNFPGQEWETLQQECVKYKGAAYAKSTQAAYSTMRDSYLRFCIYFGKIPVPSRKDTILSYLVFLSRSLSASSIPLYMNVVRIMHVEMGFDNPLANWEYSMVIKGIQRQLVMSIK